jgi:hypothetical protein
MKAVVAKNLKMACAVALAFTVVGCGKAHLTINSNKAVASSVQTASGALQVANVSLSYYGASYSYQYGVSVTLSHAGRAVNLSTGMMANGAAGSGSQSYGSDNYSISTVCVADGCDQFVVLYNYTSLSAPGVQFAVLYQAADPTIDGSRAITKLSEADGTSFNSAEDAIYTLRRLVN